MADLADIAQLQNDILTESTLSKLRSKRYQGHSGLYCCKCLEPIPDERRLAMPGCCLCIDCQREEEIRGRNFV